MPLLRLIFHTTFILIHLFLFGFIQYFQTGCIYCPPHLPQLTFHYRFHIVQSKLYSLRKSVEQDRIPARITQDFMFLPIAPGENLDLR